MFYIKKENIDKLLDYGFELETKFNYSEYKRIFDCGFAEISVDDVPFSDREYEEVHISIDGGCEGFYFIKLIHDLMNKNIIEWRDEQ